MGKVCRLTEAISGTGGGRPKSLIAAIAVAVALIAVTVVSFANVARAAGVVGTTVVDPDTTNVWTNYTRPGGQPSTQNVGRIWTDKSVFDDTYTFTNDDNAGLSGQTIEKGDSDFLVSLSALSSTSNLKEMVKTSQPLDIVLVLDTSGSMSGSKMTNLKNAANSFIDATAENNRGLEQDQQTRLAIVRFASGASTERQLNYVTDQNAQQYKSTINGFRASGATYAEEGLQQAQNVLDRNGRADVQQIVIFFTDGEPNHRNGFDNEVAAEAVNTAHEMKQGGTIVYAIGVMNGADASVTDDDGFNEYMNGVSSNYPNATANGSNGSIFDWDGYYNTTFGERAEGDYYKAASDPDSIEEIFDEISDEVQQGVGSGSPIEENTQQGNTEPGILTFEDQLGNYMQVTGTGAGKDTIQLAYGDKIYTSTSKSTEGNTDTYHFEGQVDGNEIYGAANLSDLVVTVEHGGDLATGDKVTVTLPASLLPMRHYDVDTDANTMTVSQAYPVRLFYGVSLKAEAKTALGDPTSEAYADIVASQASDDGASIDFYSNSFTKGAADGSTTASFSPNAGNKFYYYTQDTTLYTDQACTIEANRYTVGNATTLYYKDVYWVQTGNGNGAREVTDGYGTVTSGTAEWNAIERPWQGTYYIPANTQRTERPHTLTDGKETNVTGTAANVLNPSWTEAGDVTQALGNNGKLSFEKPGSLEIKKNVDWGNASDQTKQEKNTFTFDITANVPTGEGEATEALTGTYNYYVGDSDAAAGQVTFTDGSATLTVTGGTTVRIDGLPAGTTFTVTEQGVGQNGWTVTDATSQEGVENTNTTDGMVTGTIPAGSQASLTFSNTYHAREVGLNTDTTLKVQKNLEGRDWRDTDSFDFTITGFRAPSGVDPVPVPEDTVVTVDASTDAYTASFGDITFDTPGEYRYTIQENGDPEQPIAGIDYSDAIYRVTVMVGDNGTGSLVIDSVKIELMYDDGGNLANTENEGTPVEGDTMAFKNTYNASTDTEGIQGKKVYNDTTGDNPYEGGKFSFKLEAQGGFVTDSGNADDLTIAAAGTPMPAGAQDNAVTTTNVGSDFTFPTITFDGNDAGNTYVYKVTEVNTGEPGMTYSNAEHTVQISVKEVTDGDGTHIVATVQAPYDNPQNLVFENTYDPADATLTGGDAIHGTKTLTGRDMKDGETFYFQLTATNANAQSVLPNAKTEEVTSLTDGSADFNFGDMSFSKVGEYTFTVNEVADQNGTETINGSGMTYDSNVCTVTVNVTDGHDGTLKADVTYSNNVNSSVADKAQFNNTYEASMNYGAEGAGGIVVTKTLNDRSEANNTFLFTITGETEEDTAKLHDQDRKFSHGPLTPGVPNEMEKLQQLTFDETDAGKTYTFIVDELEDEFGPNESADTLKGVDFDQSQYRVDIQVLDNGNGTMHTVTTVTKTMDKDGSVVSEVVYGPSDSATDGYTAPKFGFVNDYNPDPAVVGGSADAKIELTKVLEGKAWDGDSFTFQIAADESTPDAPMPKDIEVTVSAPTGKDGDNNDQATFDFGKITFDTPGTYVYKVTEVEGDNAGITYSENVATITITVTDNHQGALVATVSIANNVFTNTYASELDYAAGGGLKIAKTFENATMREFSFTVKPKDDASAEKLGIDMAGETFTTKPGETIGDNNASHAEVAVLDAAAEAKFTQADSDDTYTYTVKETAGSDSGVTYDDTEYTVTITTADDGQGGITVTTTVTDGADYTQSYVYDNDDATENQTAVVPFTNTYKAEGQLGGNGAVSIKATKTLTNRPMVDSEFTFNLTNAADDSNTVVATGTNGANGTITFNAIDYSIDKMLEDVDNGLATPDVVDGKDTFTYTYEVTEDTTNLDDGVSAIDTAGFKITVTVTDNGDGTLGIAVTYPDGSDGLTFRNTYGEGQTGQATLNINGTKTLKVVSGNNVPSIESKYTFTLTGSEGAPMPATTEAHNDAAGNVAFGDITFTMENVFGDTGSQDAATNAEGDGTEEAVSAQSAIRTKEFTYTVTESGSVAGVDNDAEASKTFKVTVTDNGDGTLSVASNPAQGALFTFTNTYSVEPEESSPTGKGGITITKNLAGRNLNEGEFTFELVDQSGATVATGTNEASGNVELGTLKFTEPGRFTYTIREAKGSLGGVGYDAAEYKATAEVKDNGDGMLAVTWSFDTAAGDPASAIEFNNTYTATPTSVLLGGTKVLDGRALAEGEFTFVLNDADGNELQTVTNNAQGGFCFDQITYDAAGTYEYTISEVKGDAEGVTYDDATIAVKVVVTDDGKGALEVTELTYDGKTELPVFTNTYVKPVEPPKDDSGLMQTGDSTSTFVGVIAGLGALSVAVGLAARKRHGE